MPQSRKRKVLFVDDDPQILQGLKRMLHPLRGAWDMGFVEGGAEALGALHKEPFDVVVTDMRMPGMDGIQLLHELKRQFPGVVRIVLSGYSDQEMVLKSIPLAHRFLSKPCNPEILIDAIDQACAQGNVLDGSSAMT